MTPLSKKVGLLSIVLLSFARLQERLVLSMHTNQLGNKWEKT